jgi:hypothetical protein
MTSGGGDREDGRHGWIPNWNWNWNWNMADMDPELEAFIPLFPPADLTDPAAARKNLGIHAGTFMSLAIRPGRSTKRQEQGI